MKDKDRKDINREKLPKDGSFEESDRLGKDTTPTPINSDECEATESDKIEVAVVDEKVLERESESVETHVEPSAEPSRVASECLTVTTVNAEAFELSRVEHRVERPVCPEAVAPETEDEEEGVTVTVDTQVPVVKSASIKIEKTDETVSQTVAPTERVEERVEFEITTVQPTTEKMNHSVSQQITPQQSSSMDEIEPDEEDPVFAWGGGTPYGSRKPKLVIHKNPKDDESTNLNADTLPFLQTLLRDTYKEMNGGEPDGDTVDFVANEPRVPSVQKSIVTLDLTEGGWNAEIKGGKPVIGRNSDDIVPKLREVASTLYTGEMGYFVVNAPSEWEYEADFTEERFFEKLVAHLTEASGEKENRAGFETEESPPVTVAEPKAGTENPDAEFSERVSRYFSFRGRGDTTDVDVHETEGAKGRVLRKNDWKRVALTERQGTGDGESDEHYFWKATLVEGVAWQMWQGYEETEEIEDFSDFVEEEILSGEVIETESELDADDDEEDTHKKVKADIEVKALEDWAEQAVEQFLPTDEDAQIPDTVYMEFETGRSEGAFNFRKIRETLEKYQGESGDICVVVPPRLLYRGRKRAEMVVDLVNNWEDDENEARAYVPVLGSSYCMSLEPAGRLVDSLYGGNQDDD